MTSYVAHLRAPGHGAVHASDLGLSCQTDSKFQVLSRNFRLGVARA